MISPSTQTFGLNSEVIEKINGVFKKHPEIGKVILYGSRAKGNFKASSDIDLTAEGAGLTLEILLKIENELDDLLLPYKIDLSLFEKIENPALLQHIQRVGKTFYSK